MTDEVIFIVGGLGKTGRRVLRRLAARGIAARAVSRGTSPRFDWTDRASWEPALAGATAAYVTYQPDLAVPQAAYDIAAFAEAAAAAGVRHVVLLSGRGEDGAAPIEHTVLRAAWFAENFSEGGFRDGILAGELALPAGAVCEPFVSADDIADAAVAALTDTAHRNRT
ncbi:MAG TPA: NmrA family transcriptional regulator, partial [Amaricoccus sp.]|nr:NmrA family transcriptional regulator [Amaricoccus sp.]